MVHSVEVPASFDAARRTRSTLRLAPVVLLLLLATAADADWAFRNPRPTGTSLYGAAWNGTRAVAVGTDGAILTSGDGITWSEQDSGGAELLLAVTWAGDRFVVVGGCTSCPDGLTGVVYTSPDGLEWTRREPGPSGALYGVAWTGSQVVAVGEGGTILTSPDGVVWTARVSGVESHLEGVSSGGGQVVVVGYEGTILTSPDGVTWTRRESPAPDAFLRGVLATPGLILIVGETASSPTRGVVLTSPDGVGWTARADREAHNPLRSVVRHGDLFVVVGESQTQAGFPGPSIILTSPDGLTWTERESGCTFILSRVVSLGARLVAVGWSGALLTSEDGRTWTPNQRGPLATFRALCDAGDRIVVAGDRGVVASSTDGTTWVVRESGTPKALLGLAFTGAAVVAVGRDGTILSSPDGVEWETADSGTDADLHAVCFTGSLLVAVGDDGTVLTSEDAVGWVRRPAPASARLSSVTCRAGRLVAVGATDSGGLILTSETGETWDDRTPSGAPTLWGVAAGRGGFVAVGQGSGPDGRRGVVLTSPDGLAWSAPSVVSAGSLLGAGAVGETVFAVGDAGTIVASRDGSEWTEEPVASDGVLEAVGSVRGQAFAVGQDGAILERVEGARWRGFLPVAARAAGARGSEWLTDVTLVADGDGPVAATVAFRSGGDVLKRDLTLGGGEAVLLEDVLGLLGTEGAGPIEVDASRPLRLTSRTRTFSRPGDGCPPDATFGEALAGTRAASALAAGSEAWLPALAEDGTFRTNVSVANLGRHEAHAIVTLFEGGGATVGSHPLVVPPGAVAQLVRPIAAGTGRTAVPSAFARVVATAGEGVLPFAAVIDDRTNDPMAVTMLRRGQAGTDLWVPAVVHEEGADGNLWISDLVLLVPGTEPATVETRFHGPDGVLITTVEVPGGGQRVLRDFVGSLPASGTGAVRLVSDRPVLAGARVYGEWPEGSACGRAGTSAEWVPALAAEDGFAAGDAPVLAGLREGEGYRTNVSVTNAGAGDARVEVELFASSGTLLRRIPLDVPPGVAVQLLRPLAGTDGDRPAWARLRVVAGAGLFASASVIDERSGSPTVQPALR